MARLVRNGDRAGSHNTFMDFTGRASAGRGFYDLACR